MTIQNSKTHIIIGPPGTGKTTRLMNIMEKELQSGVEPNRIAYCSFTKKATDEAAERACARFNFTKGDMTYFRTIHSLAFQAMGLKRDQVMQHKDYLKIGNHLGLKFSTNTDLGMDGLSPYCRNIGDQYMFIDAFSKARHLSPKTVWDNMEHDQLNWYEFERYNATVTEYKRNKNLVDFSDMLQQGLRPLNIDVLIIDEAQDLSTAQWYFITQTFASAKRIYIGGDDDQAIYEWSGADVNQFINLTGEKETLTTSYRIPNSVHRVATNISAKIKIRSPKTYKSRSEEGVAEYWPNIDHIDMTFGNWLILARNTYLLNEPAAAVRGMGYVYTVKGRSSVSKTDVRAIELWEKHRLGYEFNDSDVELISTYTSLCDKSLPWFIAFNKMPDATVEYYRALRRRGESLVKTPRINISTIHGSKGGEADNVVLMTDMAYNTWEAQNLNQDAEHRVWYVGVTRAKQALHIIMPKGRYNYDI